MHWSHELAQRIVPHPDESHVWLITKSGSFREFSGLDGSNVYQEVVPADEYRRLEWLGGAGWVLHELDGAEVYFQSNGLWDRTELRNAGQVIQGTYVDGNLDLVELPDGRSLELTYTSGGKLASVTELPVAGSSEVPRVWQYGWLSGTYGAQTLRVVTMPDGRRWRLTYDTQLPPHLIRAELQEPGTDAAPKRVEAAWEYDSSGQLIRTWRGATTFGSATAWDRHEWSYVSATETHVTDAYGNVTIYTFDRDSASGKPRITSIVGSCPTCGLDPSSTIAYDNPANPGHPLLPWKITNGEGVTTELTYTDFGRVATRTEAAATLLERTTAWGYHPDFPALPTLRSQSSVVAGCPIDRETAWAYDPANGNLLSSTESGCELVDGAVSSYGLVTTYDYSETTGGEPSEIDPPGFEATVEDVTTLAYDAARGDQVLLSKSHALLGTESYGYDGFNRRTAVTDANGVVTTTTYDLADRVTSVTREGASDPEDERTELFYTKLGDLFCVRYPEGNGVLFEYEAGTGRLFRTTWGTAIGGTPSPPTTCLQSGQPRERVVRTFEPYGRVLTEQRERCSGTGCSWLVDARTEQAYSS